VILVAEHVGVVTMCSTTKFAVPIFAVFDEGPFKNMSGLKEEGGQTG